MSITVQQMQDQAVAALMAVGEDHDTAVNDFGQAWTDALSRIPWSDSDAVWAAVKNTLAANFPGITFEGATPVAVDPKVQQLLDQNALIADALYDLTKVVSQYPSSTGEPFADLIQDAKTKVNALNPDKFTF